MNSNDKDVHNQGVYTDEYTQQVHKGVHIDSNSVHIYNHIDN